MSHHEDVNLHPEDEEAAISQIHTEAAKQRRAARSSRRQPPVLRDEDYEDHGQGD